MTSSATTILPRQACEGGTSLDSQGVPGAGPGSGTEKPFRHTQHNTFPQCSTAAAMEAGRTAVLRVKRKLGAEPAEALVLACKRLRSSADELETPKTSPEGLERAAENNVFQLVATVRSQVLGREGAGVKGILGYSWGASLSVTLSPYPVYAAPHLCFSRNPRRSQSSRSCGPPCARPRAASSVSAIISVPLLGRSDRKAATE